MRIVFPFLTSSLKTDIIWLWALIPFWYILGVDQLIWSFAALFLTIKIIVLKINRNSFAIPDQVFMRALIAFLLIYLFSGAFMVLLHLKPTLYIKNLLLYYAGFVVVIIVQNFKTEKDTIEIMRIFCFIGIVSICVNVLTISGILHYDFQGLIGPLLPKMLLKSEYISNIIHKFPFQGMDRGEAWSYAMGILNIHRPKSIFSTANFFAGFLMITIFSSLYFFIVGKRILQKVTWLFVAVMAFLSILTTLSRSALLGLTVSTLWFLWKRRMKGTYKAAVMAGLILLGLASNYILGVQEAIEARFETGSDVARWTIYKATFSEMVHYPFFGHGTVMPYPGNPDIPDLGSHSTVLNIAFTQGIFGLAAYSVMIGYIFINLLRTLRKRLERERRILFEILFYCFIAVSVQCLFITWHYGAIYFMAIWTLWGIILKNLSAEKENATNEKRP